MKKTFLAILSASFLFFPTSFAELLDDSIIKELEKNNYSKDEVKASDFEMKKYFSCENIDSIINRYIELYRKNNRYRYDFIHLEKMELNNNVWTKEVLEDLSSSKLSSDDFSKTNTQISSVDEAEIVKTDWKYIYYFSEKWLHWNSEKFIYILWLDKKEILKKIKIPKSFYSVEFYLSKGKLIILWNFNNNTLFRENNFYHSSWKTYSIVYDVSNLDNLKLEKFYSIDWYYTNSRLIWDKLYIISGNNFSFNNTNEKFSTLDSIPEKIDLTRLSNWKYNARKSSSADCKNIEFLLPPEKYFEKNNFSLNYSIISTIDIKNSNFPVKTKIIASNTSELFMNEKSLYLTSSLYSNSPIFCRFCLFPNYSSKNLTLVNKFSLLDKDISYKKSVLIDWNPLTKYSMDEDKNWNFRILTQIEDWNNIDWTYTNLYILDKDLKLLSKLEKLWEKEHFQSSRYIWDKLFLVTFERTDPLFVIDLKDSKNPKILWELKIPGYSTYLHPYDDNHLIWLGYDTKENKWWGIQNSWVKIDLYQMNYDKKCGDKNLTKEENEKCKKWDYKWIIVKQLFTKTFWWPWSYSEALNNPKMFIWNSAKNKLFLPISLNDYEKEKWFFSWLLSLSINKKTWIKEDFRITSYDFDKLEKDRKEECKKYSLKNKEDNCKILISWEKICWNYTWNYIPNYCFKDSSIWDYLQDNSWKYNSSTINRALWVWENFYSLSPDRIKANNMNTWKEVLNLELK